MATFTTNYSLRKPASTDFVDFSADLNANWDIVDTQLKTNADNIRVPQIKIKTADTSRASTITLTDDPHLNGITLTAGKNYELEAVIFYDAPTTPKLKFKFDWTGVATSNAEVRFTEVAAGVRQETLKAADTTFLTTTFAPVPADNTDPNGYLTINAMIFCTTTGTLDFQWAQFVSDVSSTIVKKHSFIKVTEAVAT